MLRLIFILLLLIAVGLGGVVYLLVDTTPSLQSSSGAKVDNADTVKALLRQIKNSLDDPSAKQTIEVSEAQFDSLIGFAQRALPGFQGEVEVKPEQTMIQGSIELPQPLDSYFVNIEALVLPGNGVDIDYIRIGDLTIPGNIALDVAVWATDTFTQSDVASTAADQITKVTMNDQQLVMDMRPLEQLLQQLDIARESLAIAEDDELENKTAFYLAYLNESPLANEPRPQSLGRYLSLMLKKAEDFGETSDAVLHNQAVVLAMAIFIGDSRIGRLVGDVQPDPNAIAQPKAPVVLAQRNDLAQHFVISAALQVLSQQNMTMAIGEFKELMDRSMGGSGYSFVDLTADMAGMAFAKAASSSQTALKVQNILAGNASERQILPYIGGLPEGLSKREFSSRYGEVDSPAYRKQVREIQSRLEALPLYQLTELPWPQ